MARLLILLLMFSRPLAADTLHVGTTGDYQPVTWWNAGAQQFEGQDIDLITAFAREAGHDLVFIRTSWPTLMSDLQAGKFTVAVGGISHTAERAAISLPSATIHRDGKVALVRCGEEDKFSSLEMIDHPDVRVVENPGGTNERFARTRLSAAKLTIAADNHQPFTLLLAGRADVMFTDAIEAKYKESQGAGLCAVNADKPYTRIEKVFLFAQGQEALRDRFNAWLAHRK